MASPSSVESADIGAPLYVAWQLTNECNLACLHCIEESGPGKAFPDELAPADVLRITDEMGAAQVPYLALSGGEPMVHPRFFDIVARATEHGMSVKIETNGHLIDRESARRLSDLGVKAVQISLDGATTASFNKMRTFGRLELALEGMRHVVGAGLELEVNFSPTRFNIGEIAAAVELAREIGAVSFYSGKVMYTGNATRTWRIVCPTDEQYTHFFDTLREKAAKYDGVMRVYFHEMGLVEELKHRLVHPAALFIVLPNGLVKLINALPFVCGDLRRQSLADVWRAFQRSWQDERVASFVHDLERDPKLAATLHDWVRLDA